MAALEENQREANEYSQRAEVTQAWLQCTGLNKEAPTPADYPPPPLSKSRYLLSYLGKGCNLLWVFLKLQPAGAALVVFRFCGSFLCALSLTRRINIYPLSNYCRHLEFINKLNLSKRNGGNS